MAEKDFDFVIEEVSKRITKRMCSVSWIIQLAWTIIVQSFFLSLLGSAFGWAEKIIGW